MFYLKVKDLGGISAVTMNQNKPNSKSKIPTKYSVHFY